MSQIFPRSANAYARMSLIGGLSVATLGAWIVFALMRSSWVTKQDELVEQPIQFSHAHHVGDDGIDCRYCHTSVETSAFAGIPPTKTCMNCHSQLWNTAPILEPVRASFRDDKPLHWVRVHDLPDFVYFNHSIHVHKGVGCTTCHGQVDRMPLMWQESSLQMEWCVDCHRTPERYVRPRDQVFSVKYQPPPNQIEVGTRLVAEYQIQKLTSCSTCHR
jgi:Zn ribbon nucleic-acid-binding protein